MLQSERSLPYSLTGSNPYPWINWWYVLVAPRASGSEEKLSLKEREFLRRGKLTSIALLINMVQTLLELGASVQAGRYVVFLTTLTALGVLLVSLLLNRSGKILAASLLIISALEIEIIAGSIITAYGILDFSQLLFLTILIHPLMVSVLLFQARGIFVVGAINSLAIILLVLILPKSPALRALLSTPAGGVVFVPLIFCFMICALISVIMITSLKENLARAGKAEEINKLQQILNEQAQRELQTKKQLETDVQEIVAGMTRFANGDQHARIHLERGHVLWSVASSINSMVGHFVRMRIQGQEMEKTNMALLSYLTEIRTAKVRGIPIPLPNTGTVVDVLVEELYSSLGQQPHPSSPSHSKSQPDGSHTLFPPQDRPYTSRM